MLFRRRVRPDFLTRLRVAAWPRRSWSRSVRYFVQRVLRLSGTPHAIAAGVAAGVFASFTPFIGFHILIGFALAFLLGGNLLAAAVGTVFGNPLTFPLIWASTYEAGRAILSVGHHGIVAGQLPSGLSDKPLDAVIPFIKPMIVGALPLGLAAAAVVYIAVFSSVGTFQRMRRERLAARRALRGDNVKPKPAKLSEPA